MKQVDECEIMFRPNKKKYVPIQEVRSSLGELYLGTILDVEPNQHGQYACRYNRQDLKLLRSLLREYGYKPLNRRFIRTISVPE